MLLAKISTMCLILVAFKAMLGFRFPWELIEKRKAELKDHISFLKQKLTDKESSEIFKKMMKAIDEI